MPTEPRDASLPPGVDPATRSLRRRSVKSHQAILKATLELVHDVGYNQLTIEGIAARAGVGKTTIYRWWGSKGELVVEALAHLLTATPVPDSGDTRQDLAGIVEQIVSLYSQDTGARTIIAGLVGDMHHDPELAATLRQVFIEPRRAGNREVIARGIARGDLPADIDIELLIDRLAAPAAYRALVTGAPIPPDFPDRLIDQVLGPTAE